MDYKFFHLLTQCYGKLNSKISYTIEGFKGLTSQNIAATLAATLLAEILYKGRGAFRIQSTI